MIVTSVRSENLSAPEIVGTPLSLGVVIAPFVASEASLLPIAAFLAYNVNIVFAPIPSDGIFSQS